MVATAPAPVASSSRAAPAARARVPTGSTRTVSSAATNAQIEMMQAEIAETQASAEGFEKERDFYFESASHPPHSPYLPSSTIVFAMRAVS